MWVGASPDSTLIATSSWDRTVKIWARADGQLLRTLTGARGQNWAGAWSRDGRLLAVGGGDKTLRVWDAATGRAVNVFGGAQRLFMGWVRGVSFGDGADVVASSMGGTVRVLDVGSGACTNYYQIDVARSTYGMAAWGYLEISDTLRHAGARFGFKVVDGRVVVYDAAGNQMWEFAEGGEQVFGAGHFVFGRGGRRVYSGDMDGTVRVWELD
jgi:WD40 repeat protein